MNDAIDPTEVYARYDAQLIKVSNAQSEVNREDAKVDTAKQRAILCHRNLDAQNCTMRRLAKEVIAAGKAAAERP